jgi:hypothetical protein
MTIQELKRDIVRLNKSYIKLRNSSRYFDELPDIEKELKRLYHANDNFEGLAAKHILILWRINLVLRVISLHSFGINVNIEKL